MARIPTQYEDDRLLRDCLKHGELLKLSTALRIPYGTFTRQVNPDDHQLASLYHVSKNFFFELFRMRPGACLAMKADLDAAVESWVEAQSNGKDASHLVGDVANEVAELVCCRLDGKPAHLQRKEAMDVIAAVHKFVAGLDNESGRHARSKDEGLHRRRKPQMDGESPQAHQGRGNVSRPRS